MMHVAGLNENCLADPGPLYDVNVEGTRRVLQAAARAGAGRVVVTSSAVSAGFTMRTATSRSSPSTVARQTSPAEPRPSDSIRR